MAWVEHPKHKHTWVRFTQDGKLVCALSPSKDGWRLTRQYLGKMNTETLTIPLNEIKARIDNALYLWELRMHK
jgi:hypothetical protein